MSRNKIFCCAYFSMHFRIQFLLFNYFPAYKPIEDTEGEQLEKVFGFYKSYDLPVYALLFIFGTTGNVIFIIIITCSKDMRTVPNMYILNLAITDNIYLRVLFSNA